MSFLIVEGRTDAALFAPLLRAAQMEEVTLAVGGGKSAALSLARSVALSRRGRVAVVVDADTTDSALVYEQLRAFTDLLGSTANRTQIFLGRPTIEEELFPDARTFDRVFRVGLTQRQQHTFRADRKGVIKYYLDRPDPLGRIGPGGARDGFGLPFLKGVFDFLRGSPPRFA